MMVNRLVINVSLFFLFILVPFQDFVLSKTIIGALGASPAFIFVVSVFIFGSMLKYKVRIKKVIFVFVIFSWYILSLHVFLFDYTYGESSYFKGIKFSILYFLFILPFFFDYKNVSETVIRYGVSLCFCIFLLSFVVSDLMRVNFSVFNASNKFFDRAVGFYFEPSMFSAAFISIFITWSIVKFKLYSGSCNKLMFIALLISLLFQSKGAISCVVLAAFLTSFSRFSIKGLIISLILMFTCIVGLYSVWDYILLLMSTTNTFGTRFTVILSSILVLTDYPLGVGFSGFYYAFHSYLPEAMGLIQGVSPYQMKFDEISVYLNQTESTDGIGTKTFFFNMIYIMGFPFLILSGLFLNKYLSLARKANSSSSVFLIWFIILSLCTYIEGVGMYALSLSFSIITGYVIPKAHDEAS